MIFKFVFALFFLGGRAKGSGPVTLQYSRLKKIMLKNQNMSNKLTEIYFFHASSFHASMHTC